MKTKTKQQMNILRRLWYLIVVGVPIGDFWWDVRLFSPYATTRSISYRVGVLGNAVDDKIWHRCTWKILSTQTIGSWPNRSVREAATIRFKDQNGKKKKDAIRRLLNMYVYALSFRCPKWRVKKRKTHTRTRTYTYNKEEGLSFVVDSIDPKRQTGRAV